MSLNGGSSPGKAAWRSWQGPVDGFKRKCSSMWASLSCSLVDFAVYTELLAAGVSRKGLQVS